MTAQIIARSFISGALALIVAASLFSVASAAQKPVARINYDSQTKKSINVVYHNMPQGSHVRYVNVTSGHMYPPKTLPISGNGTYSVPIGNLKGGSYYILAEDSKGKRLAQTVSFYISDGTIDNL